MGGIPNNTYAALGDTISPYAAASLLYDSNYLRLSDNAVSDQFVGDKSEFIKQLKAGFDMDWKFSKQHLIINASANQNWFQNFTSLNFTGWDALAQLNWQIRSKFNGEMGYSNIESMGSYAQLNGLVSNLQNNQRFFANGGYLFHPNAKITLGWFRTERKYDDQARQISNNNEDNAELSLQYLSPTGSILGLEVLATDGQYPRRQIALNSTQDNAYKRMRYALTWDWRASPKTRNYGLIGYTQQHYANFSVRDFADIIAELTLNWQASDKTSLVVSAKRQISQSDNQFTSFLLTQGIWFSLTWQASTKITLKLPMSYQQQQYLGGTNNEVSLGKQKDDVVNIGLNLMYHPLDNVSIGPALMYEKRDSNNPFSSYETASAGASLQVNF